MRQQHAIRGAFNDYNNPGTEADDYGDDCTVMTEPVFKWWDYSIFAVLTVAMLAVLAYFLVYWFSRRDWMYYPLPFVIMTGGFLLYLFLYQVRWLCLPFMRRPCLRIPRPGWKVGVATTCVPGAESTQMLEEAVRALVARELQLEGYSAAVQCKKIHQKMCK